MIQKSNMEHRVSPQLDMFSLPAFANSGANVVLSTSLPDVPPIPSKQVLRWEKELVGLYVSAHPLQQVAANLEDTVTAFCGQIDESMVNQKVVVAGMVAWLRPHITKNDKPMAFVQLEDLQGSIEVVVFPNPYRGRASWDGVRERERFIWFSNLPPVAEIRIYTLGGDWVDSIEFNAATYDGANAAGVYDPGSGEDRPVLSGGAAAWDLLSWNNQPIATGLYLFVVNDRTTGRMQSGRFMVLK